MVPGLDNFMGSGSGHSLQGGTSDAGATSFGAADSSAGGGDAYFIKSTPESAPVWAGFLESNQKIKNQGFDMNQALLVGAGLVVVLMFFKSKRGR